MQTPPTGVHTRTAPTFYLTSPQPLRPGAILLATIAAAGLISPVIYALGHNGPTHLISGGSSAGRIPAGNKNNKDNKDDKDDPSQIDTVYLGDPADAPSPARRGDHVSSVHPTIIVRLPRFGEQVGLIPDTPAGHLLYNWLAAFNQPNYPALRRALPASALVSTTAAQIELRKQTGGFNLLAAKEAQPGVLVFRLRDQTPAATEVLGTLQASQTRPDAGPATIASFSLSAVPAPRQ